MMTLHARSNNFGEVYAMRKFEKMSDSEMEIMKVIWELAAPVAIAQLLEIFESRKWKVQTMGTFLTRLCDKGLLSVEKRKNTNIYSAAITKQKYNQLEAQNLLSAMYDGSLQNFLSALYGGGEIGADEAENLKKWFEGVGKND
jgi:predicted transcriptional regulator